MTSREETVAAVATAIGRGGVAVVRVSGPDAFRIAATVAGSCPEPGRFAFRALRRPGDGVRIDDGLVLAFAAPRSYTGEDVVEFQGHGGAVAPRRVLEACLAAGARLARRGEFTERAFLNGRITYEQAAAVLDLVEAKTDRAADEALAGLSGEGARRVRRFYDTLVALSAEAEQALDVSEDELPEGFLPSLDARRAALAEEMRAEVRRLRAGRILREGALVVLAGPPNAGKSSLMNALLGEERAIVSNTPGTTRDSIEEWLDVDGWPVRLADTAGLREAGDAIEAEGVRRARELIARAELVLRLDGPAEGPDEIAVHAKCDLGRGEGLNVSALTGEGLDGLRGAIAARLAAKAESSEPDSAAPRAAALQRVLSRVSAPFPPDPVLAANGLRSAAEELGRALGAAYSDDLLEALFSRFCVGK